MIKKLLRAYNTRRQLGSAYLVGSLRLLGVGLDDIRRYSAGRTPENMLALLAEQENRIQADIAKLRETSGLLGLYAEMAREALSHRDGEFLVEERNRERIFLCPPISAAADEDEGEIAAYAFAARHGINPGCPMGVMVAQKSLLSGEASPDYQYYFRVGKRGNTWKPEGLYAVAYGHSSIQDPEAIFLRLTAFIREQGLAIDGGAYGEYLLDELAVQDPAQYFGRIEIPVIPG